MSYDLYMKKEIEKTVFIQTNKNIVVNIPGYPELKKGEYPLMPQDVVSFAQLGIDEIPGDAIIKGMIYLIACDPNFKYNHDYKEFLKSIEGIESFIIMDIEKNKETNIKRAVIYSTTLAVIKPSKQNSMNRCYLLMELLNSTNLETIEAEIVKSLIDMSDSYPGFGEPNYHLGEYYLDKDIDMSKLYLRKALLDEDTEEEAKKLLDRIKIVENYDNAVDLVKSGNGQEALKTLLPYIEANPESLDAKYYTAIAYRQLGNSYRALDFLDELLNHGERLEVYSEIGLNLAELQDFESALEYFKKALKIMPDDSGIICNIGACHLRLRQLDEARHAFELASRINPKDDIAKAWLKQMEQIK